MTILLSILFPIIGGTFILLAPEKGFFGKRKNVFFLALLFLLAGAVFSMLTVLSPKDVADTVTLVWKFTPQLFLLFAVDGVGKVFAVVVTIVWIMCFIFAFEYMKHEENNKRYFGFFVVLYGILMGLEFSGNIVTYYVFYELMTILSAPLVLHNQSKEAIMAGLKYMFYSFFGAYMVLFGLFFVTKLTAPSSMFTEGGYIPYEVVFENRGILLIALFLMILGFSVKAGSFPLHAWLPTAHPVAPAPASAALSGIIVKAGILGVIRTVFYTFNPSFAKGTWVQTTWLILALITVFMGSMLAYRTDEFKKRLAYSTVSQLSYILFGLGVMEPVAFEGSLLHVIFHAFSKSLLFLAAGAVIYKTGCHKVSELKGIGKKMPVTIWCFAFASLCLIGIPPTGGFLSKWYLAIGALKAQIPVFSILGPVILLISALLTAGYLLPVVVKGFLPGEDYDYENNVNLEKDKGMAWMLVPMIILAVLTIVPSIFSTGIESFVGELALRLM